MAEKTSYDFEVTPQEVDFTLRMTVPSLVGAVLDTAGVDARRKGFGIDELNKDNVSWVLSRMALEIDERPRQYAPYRIETWVNEFNRMLTTRNFMLLDAAGRPFGRAVTQWCVIDLEARRAIDLTALAAMCADKIVDAPSPMEKPRKLAAIVPSDSREHRVVYSDIDFNRHVNTLRYVGMMFDMLPFERHLAARPMRFDIHFLHECSYGQLLGVGCEERGAETLFEISCEGRAAVRAALAWR
ncbi:MAG: acyl-ACP thioesterase [Alistipes sp.]|nr:acyl-ACP thioesterase [Alistipes sp.]